MRAWPVVVAGALALLACNEPAPNPSPITRIPGLAGPLTPPLDRSAPKRPPETEPPPKPPPEPVVIAPPTAQQLAGSFELHFNTARGDPLVEDDVRVLGDAKGAVLSQMVTGKTDKFDSYRLDAAAVARLLKALDATKWWSLDDARANGKDQTLSSLEVERGGYLHQFRLQGGSTGPQGEAIKLVSKLAASLGPKAHERIPAAAIEVFKPGKVAGAPEKWECEPAPGGIFKCQGARCYPQGKVLACFRTPYKTDKGVAVKPPKGAPSKLPGPKTPSYLWAFELRDGRKCEGSAVPVEGGRWICKTGKDTTEEVETVIRSGDGLFAVVGGARRVVPIVKAWK